MKEHTHTKEQEALLEAKHINKWYGEGSKRKLILHSLSVTIYPGEIIAILGPSGSGKSTFLRILAGLIEPSEGEIDIAGKPLQGVSNDIAIVFQGFALYPWLTIQQNVELGLLALNIPEEEKQKRVTEAMHTIGLHGFEHAYPKEISGGMKQRVGFARALVVQPEILMMDEPFSALDVLTAENLRHELLSLWIEKKIPTKAILLVTHNIDEAVSLADRILVLGSDPGRIRVEIPGQSLEQRISKTADHVKLVDAVYRVMTNPHGKPEKLLADKGKEVLSEEESPFQILPQVSIGKLRGFVKKLEIMQGSEELRILGSTVNEDELLALAELVDILGFGGIEGTKMVLTGLGKEFANAASEKAREVFRKQVMANVPLIQFIVNRLRFYPLHIVERKEVMTHLTEYFSLQDAELQIHTAISFGMYAELFTYQHENAKFVSAKFTEGE